MRIYVGNLSQQTTRADLRGLFAEYGQIERVGLAKERTGGPSVGYGLVEMNDEADGERAIAGLSGTLLKDRPLKVRKARARTDRKRSDDNNES